MHRKEVKSKVEDRVELNGNPFIELLTRLPLRFGNAVLHHQPFMQFKGQIIGTLELVSVLDQEERRPLNVMGVSALC